MHKTTIEASTFHPEASIPFLSLIRVSDAYQAEMRVQLRVQKQPHQK